MLKKQIENFFILSLLLLSLGFSFFLIYSYFQRKNDLYDYNQLITNVDSLSQEMRYIEALDLIKNSNYLSWADSLKDACKDKGLKIRKKARGYYDEKLSRVIRNLPKYSYSLDVQDDFVSTLDSLKNVGVLSLDELKSMYRQYYQKVEKDCFIDCLTYKPLLSCYQNICNVKEALQQMNQLLDTSWVDAEERERVLERYKGTLAKFEAEYQNL